MVILIISIYRNKIKTIINLINSFLKLVLFLAFKLYIYQQYKFEYCILV